MRKNRAVLLAVLVLTITFSFLSVPAYADSAENLIVIDASAADSGLLQVKTLIEGDSRIKLLVQKDDKSCTYNLADNGTYESFPLQMGNGEYKVSVLENIEGSKYRFVKTQDIMVNIKDEKVIYLNSIQNVKWNAKDKAAELAASLARGAESEEDKVAAIYDYIISNVKYDDEKVDKLTYDYLPDTDATLTDKKGICYDYAALFAAMLRSEGIPAKLVKGYAGDGKKYHAWNEVYLKEAGKWVVMDTTLDAESSAARKAGMIKDGSLYKKVNEY